MKHIKNCLLPLCTVLVIVMAALLPQRLSQARDQEYFADIHAEEAQDSLFSPVDDLTKRLELLAQWQTNQEVHDTGVVFATETLPMAADKGEDLDGTGLIPHSSNLEERAMDALRTMAAEIPPLQAVIPEAMEGITGERVTIYSQDGLIANFIFLNWFQEPERHLSMILDETMEKVVSLALISSDLQQDALVDWEDTVIPDLPRQFLNYLGMTQGERRNTMEGVIITNVEGSQLQYEFYFQWSADVLSILPSFPMEVEENTDSSSDVQQYVEIRKQTNGLLYDAE